MGQCAIVGPFAHAWVAVALATGLASLAAQVDRLAVGLVVLSEVEEGTRTPRCTAVNPRRRIHGATRTARETHGPHRR